MKRITLTVADDRVATIVQLLVDQAVALSVEPIEPVNGARHRAAAHTPVIHIGRKHRGFTAIFRAGIARDTFTDAEIDAEFAKDGMKLASRKATVSRARQLGLMNSNRGTHMLTAAGRKAARDIGVAA